MVNTRFFCNVSNSISSEISDTAVQKCSKPCKYYFYRLSIQIAMTLTILHSCHDKIYFFFSCFIPEAFPNELFGISIWVFIGGGAGTCHVLCSCQIILWKALKSSFTYKTNEFSIFSMCNTIDVILHQVFLFWWSSLPQFVVSGPDERDAYDKRYLLIYCYHYYFSSC